MTKNSNKTTPTDQTVTDFINKLSDPGQIVDCLRLIEIMQSVSGEPAVMWGTSIIGFGTFHYKSKSGREGDWMKIGFSPRKGQLSLYITGNAEKYSEELKAMGKHKTGKGCIYIKSLADIDEGKLTKIVTEAYRDGSYF